MTTLNIYKAIDKGDGEESLFMVNEDNGKVAISTYMGDDDVWMHEDFSELRYGYVYGDPSIIDLAIDKQLVRTVTS